MKFISFKLFSARNVIQLDEPIKFNKIRVNKLRYKSSGDYGGIMSINLIELEYEEIENNLLEIDFFDAIMKQNIV